MVYEVLKLDSRKRAAEKQARHDDDERRLSAGEISEAELKRENSFFGALDKSKFKMVAIGGEAIPCRKP